ncbi:MAG TPA: S-layer homology domain-containing protein [Chloroflexia bacterium]|nr:S-layer homology domain-containing protein [Chloroflexia bacterium]
MKRANWTLAAAVFAACMFALAAANFSASAAYPSAQPAATDWVAQQTAKQAGKPASSAPVVLRATKTDVSPAFRDVPQELGPFGPVREADSDRLRPNPNPNPGKQTNDPVLQTEMGPQAMPDPVLTFEGMSNYWGVYPPDPTGDIGRDHYVQMVNLGVEIYDRTGRTVMGPINANLLWSGFGGPCEVQNSGDPIVIYDQLADRWVLSQFTSAGTTYFECIAISTSPDPTGTYYRYAIESPMNRFPDYPKLAMWPDAYYMTTREFAPGFVGVGAYALERDKMLVGDPTAGIVYFHLDFVADLLESDRWLPSDLEGFDLPPAGAPNWFLTTTSDEWCDNAPPCTDQILIREFHVDWTDPASSTFDEVARIDVAPFDAIVCPSRNCIPQPDTNIGIDSLTSGGTGILFRLPYRNFGDYQSLLLQQTVDVGQSRSGLRWYEVRSPGPSPQLYQQSTLAPGDNLHRWMGSIAQDNQGNIALGYSVSSADKYPSIWYTGRLASDPPGVMTQGEVEMTAGSGSQLGTAYRWGDYTHMAVDPVDDCTFWYTNQYYESTSLVGWRTRIGAFRYPGCTRPAGTPTPVPIVEGTPEPTATATPCANTVIAGSIMTDDIEITGRLVANNVSSECGVQKPTPAVQLTTTLRLADAYTFTNTTGSSQCVTVRLDASTCDQPMYSVAYLESWNPDNLQENYLADQGYLGTNVFYSFDVPAGATYIVVVHMRINDTTCDNYTLYVSDGSPCPTCTVHFADVPPTNTFYPFVRCLACQGIVSGYPCGGEGEPCNANNDPYFRPNAHITRGQLAKIVSISAGFTETVPDDRQTFEDVPYGSTFWEYVERLSARGIVGGYECGGEFEPCVPPDNLPYFRPNAGATRGQLAKIVSEAAGFNDVIPADHYTFADVMPDSTFWLYVERLVLNRPDAISGYPCGTIPAEPCDSEDRPYFRPNNPLTRGQASKVVSSTFFPGCDLPRP